MIPIEPNLVSALLKLRFNHLRLSSTNDFPVVGVILHPDLKKGYVFSGKNGYFVTHQQKHQLNKSCHTCPELKLAYKANPTATFYLKRTETAEEAKALKKKLIADFHSLGYILNKLPDDLKPKKEPYVFTEAEREKRRAESTARFASPEAREKARQGRLGRKHTPETTAKLKIHLNNVRLKRENVVVDGVTYPSMNAAARAHGVTALTLGRRLKLQKDQGKTND